jgi:hypothetical protein
MDTQPDIEDEPLANDLLVGAQKIRDFLISLGMPESVDVYHLKKKKKWPIGKSGTADSASLIASKRRLTRYAQKIVIPKSNQKSDASQKPDAA